MKTTYDNEPLLQLVETGKSTVYGEFSKRKGDMKMLYSVLSIIEIVDSTDDLRFYRYFTYQRKPEISSVCFGSTRTMNALLFTETNAGKEITIQELITMKD